MRVIFGGHTGLEKGIVIGNLLRHIREKRDAGDNEALNPRFLSYFDLELSLQRMMDGVPIVSLLETANAGYAVEAWAEAFESILRDIDRRDPEHVVLQMHFTFHVRGRSPVPYDLSQLARFRPTHVVTLIDDIYECQARVQAANKERGTDYHVSLRDFAWWRAHEIGMGMWLARNLPPSPIERGGEPKPVQHFVVAVKHR